MRAILLAGGKGTRLRPLTDTIPKPLIPIDDKNLTEHVFAILKKYKIFDVTLSLGHMAGHVLDYFKKNKNHGVNLDFIVEPEPMGTAGPLILMKQKGNYPKEDFLMMNADNLFSLDIKKFIDFHRSHEGTATIALHEVEDPSSYGVVEMEQGKIIRFVEKPRREDAPSLLINSGYYVLSPEVFDFVEDVDFAMMEKDIFPRLAQLGLLYGYKGKGQWFDTGTHERYEKVKKEWRGV